MQGDLLAALEKRSCASCIITHDQWYLSCVRKLNFISIFAIEIILLFIWDHVVLTLISNLNPGFLTEEQD